MTDNVHLIDLYRARHRLRGHVLHTPLVRSPSLSEHTGGEVHLKLECRQTTGSFKLRGATNALRCLDDDARARGVIAVSTGNHGRALAYAAHRLGVRAVICMSTLVPANKASHRSYSPHLTDPRNQPRVFGRIRIPRVEPCGVTETVQGSRFGT